MDLFTVRIKTSPAIFQRILSNILRKHDLKDFTENYIDDILIFSESFKDHIEHIEKVLKAIINEGFRLKFKKMYICIEISEISWTHNRKQYSETDKR